MSFACRLASVALLTTSVALSARAAPEAELAACPASLSSLSLVGCSLAQQLALPPGSASVTVVELKTDRELPAPDALRKRVQSAVVTALAARAPLTKTARRPLHVELSLEKAGGVLRVTADARRATGLWQRILHERPSVERHAFVEARLDAELRTLIPPPPLVVSEVLKMKAPARGIVALACGPLGEERGQELALVTRAGVHVGRIVKRAFAERASASWSALSAVAPAPLREPIATADITAQGTLRVGITDRKEGLELTFDLAVVQRFEGRLPLAGGDCAARSGLGLASRFAPCAEQAFSRTQPVALDAVAGPPFARLGRALETATLTSTRPELSRVRREVGAQLAVGDGDSDGEPELAYSANTLEPTADRLTLVTLNGQSVLSRFDLAAPAISAIAICSQREGASMAPIAVATGDELWLIR